MIQVELIGCTSAGKSTLARGMLQAGREQGIDVLMGEDLVLKQVRLDWVNTKLARTLCMDLLSLFACLVTWRNNAEFYRFALRTVSRLPGSVAWLEKLNIVRNVLKKVGTHEIVRRRGSDQQIVLVDEGALHTAHYLFVHVHVEPQSTDLSDFVRLVPLPDVAIYVRQDEAVLIERTQARGHKRIPSGSPTLVALFVKRAAYTFDRLAQNPVVKSRLLVVDSGRSTVVAQDYQDDSLLTMVSEIIRAGIDAVGANNPTGLCLTQDHKMSIQYRTCYCEEKA